MNKSQHKVTVPVVITADKLPKYCGTCQFLTVYQDHCQLFHTDLRYDDSYRRPTRSLKCRRAEAKVQR